MQKKLVLSEELWPNMRDTQVRISQLEFYFLKQHKLIHFPLWKNVLRGLFNFHAHVHLFSFYIITEPIKWKFREEKLCTYYVLLCILSFLPLSILLGRIETGWFFFIVILSPVPVIRFFQNQEIFQVENCLFLNCLTISLSLYSANILR